MEYMDLQEKILSLKLESLRFQKEKNMEAQKKSFEKAAGLRDKEKQSNETLEELRQHVINLIHSYDFTNRNFEDYLNLNELLMEFHPIQFRTDHMSNINLEDPKPAVEFYWQSREVLYANFKYLISADYQMLREKNQK
jgi:hypothetical protein